MATSAPPASAASAPGNGAVPASTSGAGQPPAPATPATPDFDLTRAIGNAIGLTAPKAQPQAQPGQIAAPDPLDELLATLPADHPAHARVQGLRANDGRLKALQRQQPQQQQTQEPSREQQIAEAAIIRAVRADPNSLHELAAMAGVPPEVLAQHAGIQVGGQPAGQRRGLDRNLLDARLADRIFALFDERADPGHADSWSKPIVAARTEANGLRQRAWASAAEARLAEDPSQRARLETDAADALRRADALDLQAMGGQHRQLYGLVKAITQPLREQVLEIIGMIEKVQAADAAETRQSAAFDGMLQEAATVTAEDGTALFGPQGYGLYDVDAAGNPTAVSDMGQKMLDAIPAVMAQYRLPMPASVQELEAALRLLSTFAPSDGEPAPPAGAGADGFTAQPQTGAPRAVGVVPSLAGSPQAPRY